MPLFRRLPEANQKPQPQRAPEDQLPDEAAILETMEHELIRASRYDRPLSVLRVTAQLVPGDRLTEAEVVLVTGCIAQQLRDTDTVGVLGDGSYVAVLPETEVVAAQAAAQRLAVELTLRSGSVKYRNWLVGAASWSAELESAAAIVDGALIAAMQTHGRRAA